MRFWLKVVLCNGNVVGCSNNTEAKASFIGPSPALYQVSLESYARVTLRAERMDFVVPHLVPMELDRLCVFEATRDGQACASSSVPNARMRFSPDDGQDGTDWRSACTSGDLRKV